MAEPFNELDVQHELQEIAVQARYTLCNGTTAVRLRTRANRYAARAGHAKPLYEGYTHSTHTERVQLRVKRPLPVLAMPEHCTRGTSTVHTVRWYSHSTARVQKRVKHTLPVLAMPDHCTRGTSTVHTVQWYNHSTNTNTGLPNHCTTGTIQCKPCGGTNTVRAQTRVSRYITRAGHARTLYKGYKHGTSVSRISTSPVLATPSTVQVVHAQYIRTSDTPVYYARRPSHHVIYCTTHAYT